MPWTLRKHKLTTASHVRQLLRADVGHVDAPVDRLEPKEVFSQTSYARECREIYLTSDVLTIQFSRNSARTVQQSITCATRKILTRSMTTQPLLDEPTETRPQQRPSYVVERYAVARSPITRVEYNHKKKKLLRRRTEQKPHRRRWRVHASAYQQLGFLFAPNIGLHKPNSEDIHRVLWQPRTHHFHQDRDHKHNPANVWSITSHQ